MGLLGVNGGGTGTAHRVYFVRNRLEMVWIDAPSIPAFVIENQSTRRMAIPLSSPFLVMFVRPNVRRFKFSLAGIKPPVPGRFCLTKPNSAPGVWFRHAQALETFDRRYDRKAPARVFLFHPAQVRRSMMVWNPKPVDTIDTGALATSSTSRKNACVSSVSCSIRLASRLSGDR